MSSLKQVDGMPQSWPVVIVGIVLGLISLSIFGCLFYVNNELSQFALWENPDPSSLSWVSEAIYSYASEVGQEDGFPEDFVRIKGLVIIYYSLGAFSILIFIASIYLIYTQFVQTDFENAPENG